MPGDKTAAVIVQGALDGNPVALLLLTIIAACLVYLVQDRVKFKWRKKKQGVKEHVVQTENTAGMTKELRRSIVEQERTNSLLADLVTGVRGMNELHERCQKECKTTDERTHRSLQELLTKQTDSSDTLNRVHHDVRKLVTG